MTAQPGTTRDTTAARPSLDDLVSSIVESYRADSRTEHINASFLPSRDRAIQTLDKLRELVFPGFFGSQKLTHDNIRYHVGELLQELREQIEQQIESALRYTENLVGAGRGDACEHCAAKARDMADAFLTRLPEVRAMLALDVQAAYDGDPAARNTDEAVFCYPGVFAVFVYRIAHEFYKLGVPLLPRIMTEYAHGCAGIDIHPGPRSAGRSSSTTARAW
jgi:serine O-acetyltransferase